MPQQTQVDPVIPKWRAFLDRFPTAASCACSSRQTFFSSGRAGLSRAGRNLHNAARMIADSPDERGRFPRISTTHGIAGRWPVHRSRARFAFEQDAAVVDTSIARIFARLTSSRLTHLARYSAWPTTTHGTVWDWNQSLLDRMRCRLSPSSTVAVSAQVNLPLVKCTRPVGPTTGSARSVSQKAPFEGSDRQTRGRLISSQRVRLSAIWCRSVDRHRRPHRWPFSRLPQSRRSLLVQTAGVHPMLPS